MAVTMLDWRDHGQAYAAKMIEVAQGLAAALKERGVPVFETANGATSSHQFAVRAAAYGGGQAASKQLYKAGFLACGIGLPIDAVAGDMNGLRIGTPELVRWGVDIEHVDQMADLITEALGSNDPSAMAPRVREWRETFDRLHYIT
jgi:glycine hydroxymethyltransferase